MAAWEYTRVESFEGLAEVARAIESSKYVGLDTETFGRKPWNGHIRLLQIKAAGRIFVVDLMSTFWQLGPIEAALKNTNAVIIGQNLKYDQAWMLHHYGIEFKKVFDTWRASCLIHNGKNDMKHDLYAVAERELGATPGTDALGGSDWARAMLTEEQWDYAAWDVLHLEAMREKLVPQLDANGLRRVALTEFQAILPEACMELSGLALNPEKWMALDRENRANADRLHGELLELLPDPTGMALLPGFTPSWNLGSTKMMLKALQSLGLPVQDTREATLALYAAECPAVSKLLQYRGYMKRVQTYGEAYLANIDPWDDRIHASYYPMLKTGRYSCSDPNLQQLPRTKDYRSCFEAPYGKVLVMADYSQIELRFVAQISGDRHLLSAYKHGEDVHAKTAGLIAKKNPKDVSKAERQAAKPANFGFSFGMGWKRFIQYAQMDYGVSFSPQQAQELRDGFFDGYPGIRRWHKKALEEGQRTGIVRSPGGRLRYVEPDTYNEILNTPVQAGAADGLKAALRQVYNRLRKYGDIWKSSSSVKMAHMVHDEILIETDDIPEIRDEVQILLVEGMQEGMGQYLTAVPPVAEPGVGQSWADKG
jgi:DNA polymerase I-like protein with 3'-5' exonuclease and polymerase domains